MRVAAPSSERPTVLITEPIGASGMRILEQACTCIAPWRDGVHDEAPLRAELRRVEAVIVRLFAVDASDLAAAQRLKVVAKHGAGLDNIDCQAATERGIPVIYTPGANANAVAEHAIGLLLALARNTCVADTTLRDGRAYERGQFQGIELAGKTLAIIGLGRIGSRVARKAHGLDMQVIAYDPYVDPASYAGPATLVDSFDHLLAGADFVTLHVPLTAETRNMIDSRALAGLKPTCRLINTSRGGVIDERNLERRPAPWQPRRSGARRIRTGTVGIRPSPVPSSQHAADTACERAHCRSDEQRLAAGRVRRHRPAGGTYAGRAGQSGRIE